MPLNLIVEKIEPVTARVSLFTLALSQSAELPPYTAGAHLDFDLGDVGTRSYSLIDFVAPQPLPHRYQIAVQREDEGDGGSLAMHALTPGDALSCTEPKNDFKLHTDDAPALLLAGGIGVTPMISFAAELTRRNAPFDLHYTTRSESVCAFGKRLSETFKDSLTLWFDDSHSIELDTLIGAADPSTHIYCCGPRGMIEAVKAKSLSAGFPESQIHFELFSSPGASATGDDQSFEVEIDDTGDVYTIPAGKTIIEVLEEAGLDLIYDCQRGDCGICQTDVISGEPDHRDVVLSEAERASGNVMQICVSRAKSGRLVLDI